jgi:hypothetical protein
MAAVEPQMYSRPNGERLAVPSLDVLRQDFLDADPRFWNSEEGFALLERNRDNARHSYIVCGFVDGYGFFICAVLDRLTENTRTLVPLTSQDFKDVAKVWNGQSYTPMPRAFSVTPQQAAEIAITFWQTGDLLPIVRWVRPEEHGWDFTSSG